MSLSHPQRRRGRSRDPEPPVVPGSTGADALDGLRRALTDLDARAFATCFSAGGWVRMPHPDGDLVLRGPGEIEDAGRALRASLTEFSWTPSQRFVAAGQVVEEAMARVRTAPGAGPWGPGDEARVSMRVVVAFDPAGGIGSLTLWVDWAALLDPDGVQTARGAASALVAQARARDDRGLRVIESDPWQAALPAPPPPEPEQHRPPSTRPPAAVRWWKRHRATLAGSVMALAAAGVIGWVGVSVLKPIADARINAAKVVPGATAGTSVLGAEEGTGTSGGTGTDGGTDTDGGTGGTGTGGTGTGGTGTGGRAGTDADPTAEVTVTASEAPVIKKRSKARPKVQEGTLVPFQADVLFESGSPRLSADGKAQLDALAQRVKDEKRRGNIQINGYTDIDGTEAFNLDLSFDRANTVAKYLRPALTGLPVSLNPQGFGETSQLPDTDSETDAGKAKNRRVNIILPTDKTRSD